MNYGKNIQAYLNDNGKLEITTDKTIKGLGTPLEIREAELKDKETISND